MGGNHFNNIRCLILHLAFGEDRCVVLRCIYNDAASGRDCLQTILPGLTGRTVALRDRDTVLIQDIVQRLLEDRTIHCLLSAFDKKCPREIQQDHHAKDQVDPILSGNAYNNAQCSDHRSQKS